MLLSALALGFLGSLHCLGMCGPIAFMLPLDRDNKSIKLLQLSLYHLGRLMAYAILGFTFGFVGKGLQLFGAQQKLSIAIGTVMIVLALVPLRYIYRFQVINPIQGVLAKVRSALGQTLKKRAPDTFLTIGFLNGFLPCGLVYVALFGAIALGTPLQGGLYMLLFGLGTIPLMTSALFASGWFGEKTKVKIRKLVPVFVVAIGFIFIIRGLGLGIPYLSPKPVIQEMVSTDMDCQRP